MNTQGYQQYRQPQQYAPPPYTPPGDKYQDTVNMNTYPVASSYETGGPRSSYAADKVIDDFDGMLRRSLTIKIYATLILMIFGSICFTIILYFILMKVVFNIPDINNINTDILVAYVITEILLVLVGLIGYIVIACINSCCRPQGRCGIITMLILAPFFAGLAFTGLSMALNLVAFGAAMLGAICVLILCTSIASCIKKPPNVWLMIAIAVCGSQILWILYPMIFVWNFFGGYVARTLATVVVPVVVCLIYTLEIVVDTWLAMRTSCCSDWSSYAVKIYTDVVGMVLLIMNAIGASRR